MHVYCNYLVDVVVLYSYVFFCVFCVTWETIRSLLNFQEVILSSDDDEGEVGSSFWYNFTFLYLAITVFICLKYTVTHR